MKYLQKSLMLLAGIIASSFILTGIATAYSVYYPFQGGTGTSTIPTIGQVLVGLSNGTYAPQATSTLGITGGGGSGNLAWTIGNGLIYNATSTDKVGVGTSTPTFALDLQGSTSLERITANDTTGQPTLLQVGTLANELLLLKFTKSSAGSIPASVWQFRSSGTSRDIAFSNTDNTPILFLKTSTSGGAGDVGIGTSTPNARLDIYGQPGVQDILDVASSSNAKFLVVNSSGNVGIGTTTVNASLTVNGSQSISHKTVNGNYTIATSTDFIVGESTTTAVSTITLPNCTAALSTTALLETIKDEGGLAGTFNITIAAASGDTIDGASTKVINVNYSSINLYCGSTTKWFIY